MVALVGGGVAATALKHWYAVLPHPPGAPSDRVFAPISIALYLAAAVAAWRVWLNSGFLVDNRRALMLWGWQLGVGAVWAPVFFGLHRPDIALFVIAVMDVLIALTILAFRRIDRLASWLLVPYLAWGLFTVYLNAGFWWLNR